MAISTINLSTLDGTNGFRLVGAVGNSVSGAGDVNGDGFDDLIVGTEWASPNGTYSGASYVVFGKSSGFASSINLSTLDGTNGFRLEGVAAGDRLEGVSAAGDVNGDGVDDLIVGSWGADPNGADSGAAYVIFGKSGGFAASINLSTLDGVNGFRLEGVAAGDRAGFSVSGAGDVNGDGFDDLIVGAYLADANGGNSGASYVVFGKSTGFAASLNLSTLDGTNGFKLAGVAASDFSGHSVSGAGDVNGDGFDDLIVGAFLASPSGSASGASYVVFGKSASFAASVNLSTLDGSNGFRLEGITASDISGWSVSGAGDVNGDGFDDLIVGAPGADPNGSSTGASYVVFGKSTGFASSINLSTLDGTNGFRLDGVGAGDEAGRSVSAAGDVNNDGFDDLIVGAVFADANGSNSGESYVVFGKSSGFASSIHLSTLDGMNGFRLAGSAFNNSGNSVSGTGDVNGDGFDDVIVGTGNLGASLSYVLFGANFSAITTGTAGNDLLNGTADDDSISGLAGNDTLNGLGGNDFLDGGDDADSLDGGDGNDTLVGANGNDTLTGGSGVDSMAGGTGDDIFIVDEVLDSVVENTGEGTDTVITSVSIVLPDHVEILQFVGNGGVITGNAQDNVIAGSPFDDTIIGAGGNDTVSYEYETNPVTIDLFEGVATGSGTDALQGFQNAKGGAAPDVLIGNDNANALDGQGGADTMQGGAGDDTYYVDEENDAVVETGNELLLALASSFQLIGDTVIASVNYSLQNVAFVENLTLAGAATTGTGNALNNVITGNALNNTLNGLTGNDSLDGASGLDTTLFSGSGGVSAVSRSDSAYTVTGPDGSDTLTNIERLQFSDKKLALDLGTGEAAGNTVRIIGAAFDTPYINPTFVRIGLNLFDSGQKTMVEVCQLAIDTGLFQNLTGSSSNEAFVNLVFQNVVGFAPSDAQRATFVGMLQDSGGTMTQAELLVLAASHPLNALNINLVGLQETGVEFA